MLLVACQRARLACELSRLCEIVIAKLTNAAMTHSPLWGRILNKNCFVHWHTGRDTAKHTRRAKATCEAWCMRSRATRAACASEIWLEAARASRSPAPWQDASLQRRRLLSASV